MGCSLLGFFQTACNNNLKQCLKEQSFLAGKAQCFVDYGKCLINKGSVTEALMDASNDGEPGRHPYVVSSINLCARKLPMDYFSSVSLIEGGGGNGDSATPQFPSACNYFPKYHNQWY